VPCEAAVRLMPMRYFERAAIGYGPEGARALSELPVMIILAVYCVTG
jgi:hypothetical protein